MPEQAHRYPWRQIALLVFFIGSGALIVFEFSNPSRFLHTLASLQWYWLLVSVVLFALSFYLNALLFRVGLQAVDVFTRTYRLLAPLMVSILLSTAIPFGEAIFIEHAREQRQSGARAAVGATFVLIVNLATDLPFLAYGLIFLATRGALPFYYTLISSFFFVYTVLLALGLWLAKARPDWLRAFFDGLQRIANWLLRVLRRERRVQHSWVEGSTGQFSDAVASITRHPVLLADSIAVALLFHIATALGIYTLFLTVGRAAPVGTTVAGFAFSQVLAVVAVTPHGAGPTEQVMAMLFHSSGERAEIAVTVSLLFRVFNIWIPLFLGYVFARRMRLFGGGRR